MVDLDLRCETLWRVVILRCILLKCEIKHTKEKNEVFEVSFISLDVSSAIHSFFYICFILTPSVKSDTQRQADTFLHLIFYSGWQWWSTLKHVWASIFCSCSCSPFTGISQTGRGTELPGTCPGPHGPQGWSPRGRRWPAQPGCCERESVKTSHHHLAHKVSILQVFWKKLISNGVKRHLKRYFIESM